MRKGDHRFLAGPLVFWPFSPVGSPFLGCGVLFRAKLVRRFHGEGGAAGAARGEVGLRDRHGEEVLQKGEATDSA